MSTILDAVMIDDDDASYSKTATFEPISETEDPSKTTPPLYCHTSAVTRRTTRPKRAVFPEDAASLRAWSYYLTAAGIQHRISQLTHFTLSPVLRRQMVFASRIGMPMATEAGAFDSVSFCRSSAMTAANLHSGNIAIKLVESVAAHAFPDHQGVGVAPHPAPWKSRPDAVQQGSRGWRLQALQRSRQEGRLPWCQSP